MKFLPYLIAATLLVLTQMAWATDPCPPQKHLLEKVKNGTIDWSSYSVTVPLPPAAAQQPDQCVTEQFAVADKAYHKALSDLMAIISSLPLNSDHLVEDRLSADPLIKAQLEEIIATAPRLTSANNRKLGFKLDGAFLQLILPEEIKQLAEIQTVTPNNTPAPENRRPGAFTGLVVDARAVEAAPALVAEVIDENGRQVYGPAFVSRDFAVQYGAAIYAPCINASVKTRVGQKPLIIRALKAMGPQRSTLVISSGDASRLRSASSHLSFLRQARVVILLSEKQSPQIEGKP